MEVNFCHQTAGKLPTQRGGEDSSSRRAGVPPCEQLRVDAIQLVTRGRGGEDASDCGQTGIFVENEIDMSAVLHEGAVYYLPARFRLLLLSAIDLLETMARYRNQTTSVLASGGEYAVSLDQLSALSRQLGEVEQKFERVRRDIMLEGNAVALLLHDVRETWDAIELVAREGGRFPSDIPVLHRQVFQDMWQSLSPLPAKEVAERKTQIESEIRAAASKIAPRLGGESPEAAYDFVLEVLNVVATPKLTPREISVLEQFAQSEGSNGCVTDQWERQQIKRNLPAIQLVSGVPESPESNDTARAQGGAAAQSPKQRRNAPPGSAQAKIEGYLCAHHGYSSGKCTNYEPLGVRKLAGEAGVAPGSVTNFFNLIFMGDPEVTGGHDRYKQACHDGQKLDTSLKLLSGDMTPHVLWNSLRQDVEGDD